MTPAQAAPAPTSGASARTNEAAEAAHLRRLVEKQPACLLRVAVDGAILAANDAALGLLGAKLPSDVLGNTLHSWIIPAHEQIWKDFVGTVAAGTSLSIECDLKDLQGVERSVVFHGVPLIDHMDGIPSVILGARDASGVRRLEAALQESEMVRQQLAAHSGTPASPEAAHELQELQARLDEAAEARARLELSVSKLPQLEQLLKQGKVHLQELRTRLEGATAERDRIAAQLHERESANEQLWSDQVQLQQSLAEQHDRDVVTLRADLEQARTQLEQARAELAQARESDEQMRNRLQSHEADHTGMRAELEEAKSAEQYLTVQLRNREAEHAESRAALERAKSAEQDLAMQLRTRENEHAESQAALEQARSVEQELAMQLRNREAEHAESKAALEQARSAEQELALQLRNREAEHERLTNEQGQLRESLEARQRQELQELSAQLEQFSAEKSRLAGELVRQHEEHHQSITDAAMQHQSQQEELAARLREFEAALHAGSTARAELERNLLGLQLEQTEQKRIADEQLGEIAGLRSSLAQLTQDRERVVQELRDASSRQHEADKALADYRVELQSIDLAVRKIEPFAAAGRAALDLAGELLAVVGDIDARSACLVAESPLESSSREQVEQLRAEAVRAGLLARQILQTSQISPSEERK